MTIENTQELILNLGPQHPSMHGLFRAVVHLEGETVTKIEPKIGYLHRGMEKLAESRTYSQFIPYTDRLDYLASPHNNWAYVMTVEKLMGVEIPERAEYLRVIFGELARIASHHVMIASTALDLGGSTPWMYIFRDRERILDMFEMTAGSRLTVNMMRIGGMSAEPPAEFWPALKSFLDDAPEMLEEYYGIFFGNEIVQSRMKHVGILPKELAENLSITGPVLRASGVSYDVRKAEPYSIYDRFDFNIPVRTGCDSYDRTIIRMDEIVESLKIIRQAVRDIPEGPIMAKVPKVIKPPAGEVYHRVENPKGELGFYIVSDGTTKPSRVRIRPGTFINLQMLPIVALNWKIQDLIVIFATLDAVLGEVDK
ncbi:MAG TPA: NADH-quinone oxidoreductase subunit D [Desulfosporosinus sp.]